MGNAAFKELVYDAPAVIDDAVREAIIAKVGDGDASISVDEAFAAEDAALVQIVRMHLGRFKARAASRGFDLPDSLGDTGYLVTRPSEGWDKVRSHVRLATFVLALNAPLTIEWSSSRHRVMLPTGGIAMFPSSWNQLHKVHGPNGAKQLTGDVIYKFPDARN